MAKKILIAGGGGFIGHHLARRLKKEGNYVVGWDLKYPEYSDRHKDFNEFYRVDLREPANIVLEGYDEVYQLAANMGGMGFINSHESEIMHDNSLININMIDKAARHGVKRYLYTSSVCVYRNMEIGEEEISEDDTDDLVPDNEYGWEKLYAERVVMAYGRKYPIKTHIARLQNCFGEEGTFDGGREKAPAAMCRKVLKGKKEIEVWGDGTAVRNYNHVDNFVDALIRLMVSNVDTPVNIGSDIYISVDELARRVMKIAGKELKIKHVPGPEGVKSRNFSNKKLKSLGWKEIVNLDEGLRRNYEWLKHYYIQQESSGTTRVDA